MMFTTAQRYDARDRVTGTIAPDPDGAGPLRHAAVRNSYDGAGNLTKVETGELASWPSASTAPANWTGFTLFRSVETEYDAVGHKIRETLKRANGTAETMTQYGYDLAGRLECTAVRMNLSWGTTACTPATPGIYGPDRITRTIYDAAGQRVQLRAGVGSSVEGAEASWDYSPNGQITTVIDGNGNRATLQYDDHGRQSGWTFPSATRPTAFDDSTLALTFSTAGAAGTLRELYEYDPNGNRRFLTRRDGARIEYQYDALNRMTVKIVPSRTTGPQALTAAQVRDVYYSYDLRNLQTGARFDSISGDGITNAFDGFGRLSWTSTNMSGTARRLDYQYDPNGNRTRITHPDGHWFDMTWDGLNRPHLLRTNGTTTLAATEYYAHGAPWVINRIATATEINYDQVQRPYVLHHYLGGAADVVWTSQFNTAGQVLSTVRTNDAYAWTGHYAVNRGYTTNGLNQYTLAGPTALLYDDNGNLITSGANYYVYDMENRMVGAPGNVALSYDPLGRLFQVSNPSSATQFLYDGDAMVAEYNGANVLQRRHVHNVGADVPMVTYAVTGGTGLGTITQLYADRQGSIATLANGSGVTTAINTYDEYGIPGAGNTGRFQYTGQIWLAEIGMYHYKARVYSPYLGRFMQTDPIGYEDQFNLYAYVGNDPVNGSDPTGTSCDPAGTQEGGAPAFACKIDGVASVERQNGRYVITGERPVNSSDGNKFDGFNATYTEAANAASREAHVNPDRGVTVEPFGSDDEGSFPTNATNMLLEMRERRVLYADDGPPDTDMQTLGGPGMDRMPTTYVYDSGLNTTPGGVAHDIGLHGGRDEVAGRLQMRNSPLGGRLSRPHQRPYNRAACRGIGRRSPC